MGADCVRWHQCALLAPLHPPRTGQGKGAEMSDTPNKTPAVGAGNETPTPRTDAQEYYIDGYYHVSADLARTLERHLRRIVDSWTKQDPDWATPLDAAIQAAKEELSK